MEEEKELPKRKDNRLKNHDYSRAGAYFITICTKDRCKILSHIVGVETLHDPIAKPTPVGVDTPHYRNSFLHLSAFVTRNMDKTYGNDNSTTIL